MKDQPEIGCPFCIRIEEKQYDEYFRLVFDVVTFEPLNPVTPGHRLFVPVDHVNPLQARDVWNSGDAMAAVGLWQMSNFDAPKEHFNLILNAGSNASQTIQHMHLHYVPRREGDGLMLPWTNQVTL